VLFDYLRRVNQHHETLSTATCNKTMKDLEVIHVYLATQNNPCFTLLYNRYVSKVYAKCISILKEENLAHDATQEIFLKIFLNLSKFGEKAQFSTWIYSITYNFCIDYLRKNKKYDAIFSDKIEQAPDLADEVPDEVLLEMEVKTLRQVIDKIPEGDRIILFMKYQDDLPIKDIAEILQKTESAVKMQIKRAKAKAQKIKEDLMGENPAN
jgi:RNA polymerase sigma factor (sigma-70 family)